MNPRSNLRCSGLLKRLTGIVVFVVMTGLATAGNIPDYEIFDDILLKYVRKGFVDYDGAAEDPRLLEIIVQFGDSDPALLQADRDKLAFYINTYNALAIKGILDNSSPATRWGRYRFFKRNRYLVAGEKINLYDLEHDRLIAIGDPRIHFAIVCASLSCPRLSSHAYIPDQVDTQLHEAARRFINDPTRNRFDLERRIAFISMIFEWYADDFEKASGSVQKYLARFVDDARVQDALRLEEFSLRYERYDWNLNGQYSGGN